MGGSNVKETAEYLMSNLRLKTFPVAVAFREENASFPEKARRPAQALGKRITICQAVTMARLYGWTVGLTRDDLICVPAMIAFGFSGAADPATTLAQLFCEVGFHAQEGSARAETASMSRLEDNENRSLLLAPLAKDVLEPDTVLIYGNPAQVMRLVQACAYQRGERVQGYFGGKVECSEYLIAPFKTNTPRVSIPGMGDRIFSMTQDDEMVFSLPGAYLNELVGGLQQAGKNIGARYPVTFYQNFQPEFPKPYKVLGAELGLLK